MKETKTWKREEREKKRGAWSNHAHFFLQGSLWFVFRAPGNHGTDDSRGNQISLESMDTPFKQRHCRLHSWDRESTITTDKSQLAKILFQVREMFHEKLVQPLNRNPVAFYITCILNCVYKHFNKNGDMICSLMHSKSLLQVANTKYLKKLIQLKTLQRALNSRKHKF